MITYVACKKNWGKTWKSDKLREIIRPEFFDVNHDEMITRNNSLKINWWNVILEFPMVNRSGLCRFIGKQHDLNKWRSKSRNRSWLCSDLSLDLCLIQRVVCLNKNWNTVLNATDGSRLQTPVEGRIALEYWGFSGDNSQGLKMPLKIVFLRPQRLPPLKHEY